MAAERTTESDNVRMGPISLFTLIIVLCLAVLSVLSVSTSNASLTMAQRRATATTELYLDETAAQAFMAYMDDELAGIRAAGGTGAQGLAAVDSNLAMICANAKATARGDVTVTASVKGDTVNAEFTCENGRTLIVQATIRDDCTYRIEKWKMTAVQNEEPTTGGLWTGA